MNKWTMAGPAAAYPPIHSPQSASSRAEASQDTAERKVEKRLLMTMEASASLKQEMHELTMAAQAQTILIRMNPATERMSMPPGALENNHVSAVEATVDGRFFTRVFDDDVAKQVAEMTISGGGPLKGISICHSFPSMYGGLDKESDEPIARVTSLIGVASKAATMIIKLNSSTTYWSTQT